MTHITLNLAAVRQRIALAAERYGREADKIALLAVSKRHPAAAVGEAFAAGQTHFGENFVQEAVAKQAQLPAALTWHFIGHIQSNKTRLIAAHFDWVHTVDSARIAARLAARREREPALKVCIQVNLSDDPQRAGIAPDAALALAHEVHGHETLALRGLMVLPPMESDFERQRHHFRVLAELAHNCAEAGLPMRDLSMGMTGDLEAAVAEGATWLRIGTAIFGPRPAQRYPTAHT